MKHSLLRQFPRRGRLVARSVAHPQHGSIAATLADSQIYHVEGTKYAGQVLVRKCFCEVPTCARKIFAERIIPFVAPWARVTARLFQIVQAIGLATGGMLGARLAERLGIHTSWMTILRWIMALPTAPIEQVSQLGVDDFAFRRGRKYGTILVDMESHRVIDVSPSCPHSA